MTNEQIIINISRKQLIDIEKKLNIIYNDAVSLNLIMSNKEIKFFDGFTSNLGKSISSLKYLLQIYK